MRCASRAGLGAALEHRSPKIGTQPHLRQNLITQMGNGTALMN